VELIVVIAIIGILSAVLIPSLTGYIAKARQSSAEQDALNIYKEFMADIDPTDDEELFEGDFVVESGEYLVVIVNGAVSASYKVANLPFDLVEIVDMDKDIFDYLSQIDYFILDQNGVLDQHNYYSAK